MKPIGDKREDGGNCTRRQRTDAYARRVAHHICGPTHRSKEAFWPRTAVFGAGHSTHIGFANRRAPVIFSAKLTAVDESCALYSIADLQ